ncbi:hypothetical protein EVAR_94935_1 [Eumeta japonica]|uniref:Uncharacterized protein n=1 Tax=Eumeta variegata TaxID=151549 RepID=A0A4C1Z804_EUMVA|nr:hypothetical protein EVAR_94935_1 [Eumeta japonica]
MPMRLWASHVARITDYRWGKSFSIVNHELEGYNVQRPPSTSQGRDVDSDRILKSRPCAATVSIYGSRRGCGGVVHGSTLSPRVPIRRPRPHARPLGCHCECLLTLPWLDTPSSYAFLLNQISIQ